MMRNFVCWNPADVRQVINPYAEHIPDGLFRAVHSDWDLKVSPPIGKSFPGGHCCVLFRHGAAGVYGRFFAR